MGGWLVLGHKHAEIGDDPAFVLTVHVAVARLQLVGHTLDLCSGGPTTGGGGRQASEAVRQ